MSDKVFLWLMRVAGMIVWAGLFFIYSKLSGQVIPDWGWILIALCGSVSFGSKDITD